MQISAAVIYILYFLLVYFVYQVIYYIFFSVHFLHALFLPSVSCECCVWHIGRPRSRYWQFLLLFCMMSQMGLEYVSLHVCLLMCCVCQVAVLLPDLTRVGNLMTWTAFLKCQASILQSSVPMNVIHCFSYGCM
jgi:hypothetical protein